MSLPFTRGNACSDIHKTMVEYASGYAEQMALLGTDQLQELPPGMLHGNQTGFNKLVVSELCGVSDDSKALDNRGGGEWARFLVDFAAETLGVFDPITHRALETRSD